MNLISQEPKCTCKEHDPYCCQVHGSCPTCVKKQEKNKKMYSEEELELLIYNVCGTVARLQGITLNGNNIKAAFEQFKNK